MSGCTFSLPSLMVGHMAIDAEKTNRVCVGDEKAELKQLLLLEIP
jgi:hypothetical protein